jgi:hypothetical protein
MTQPPEEERFFKNIIEMVKLIRKEVQRCYHEKKTPIDPQLIDMIGAFLQVLDKHTIIRIFINNSHTKCWDKIKMKDREFFRKDAGDIFASLPMDKVNLFSDLFFKYDEAGNRMITDDFERRLWAFFDSLVKISIKYVHKHREPDASGTYTKAFSVPEVDIEHHMKSWDIKM